MIVLLTWIGAFTVGACMTVVVVALWAGWRDRRRARRARGATAGSPVYVLPQVHGDGGSISDVVRHFEDLYR